jgi:hypothetical protein
LPSAMVLEGADVGADKLGHKDRAKRYKSPL